MTQPTMSRRVRVTDPILGERATAMTISLTQVAEILGIHRTTAWALYKRGEFPVPVLRIGSSLRIVRAHLELYMSTGIPVEPGTRTDALKVAI